jgi:formamidopyrimidine-DNA glycosylase
MPELPEVETVRRTLEPSLVGKTIIKVEIVTGKIVKQPGLEEFNTELQGREVAAVKRRGKYLLLELSGNKTLVVHLRMTGQFTYCSSATKREKHTHLMFTLSDGQQLRYVDTRQFGEMHLLPTEEYSSIRGLSALGPEPLGEGFYLQGFQQQLAGKKTKLKALLLDQSFLAGMGNIYVDEALFRAGVQPDRSANSLTAKEAGAVYTAVREVLAEGIEFRGTSIKDYVDGDGRSGSFQERLQVYGRAGATCKRCGDTLEKARVAGRTTVFCSRCQQ